MADLPPFATPTLARLYLAQGHLDKARAIAARLEQNGRSVSGEDAEPTPVDDPEAVLNDLLDQVRERRRG